MEVNNSSYLLGGVSTAGIRFVGNGELKDKHVSLEEVICSDELAVWYTQEHTPVVNDGKLAKHYKLGKAHIYLGNLNTGESHCIYNGDCMGDLVIQENELFFNMGTKIAVLDLTCGELEILFKHGGVKNNFVRLSVNGKHIAYRHKKGDATMLMVYDRETKETTNLKCDVVYYNWLSSQELIYSTFYHTMRVELATGRKKRYLTAKEALQVMELVVNYYHLPLLNYSQKDSDSRITFICLFDCRIYFEVSASWCSGLSDISYDKERQLLVESGMPFSIHTIISCPLDAKAFTVEHNNEGWSRRDRMLGQFSVYDLETKYNPFI